MSAPFAISAEAEQHLRKYLARRPPPSAIEPSLTLATRSRVRDKEGRLVERCDHEHYFLGYNPPEKHTGYYRLSLGGTELAISPSTLDTLRGKCLSVKQLPRLDNPDQSRQILVATPLDESTPKA